MRIARLVRTAVDAEVVLIKSTGQRLARRIAISVVAALLLLFALAFLHVMGFLALEDAGHVLPVWSASIVAAGDVVVATVMLLIARSGGVSAAAIEAKLIRDRALADLKSSFALATLTGPAGRYAGRGVVQVLRSAFTRRRRRSRVA